MVSFYSLLCQADPAITFKVKIQKTVKTKKSTLSSNQKSITKKDKKIIEDKSVNLGSHLKPKYPEISINLQIHISSDASTDQIDQIFESMAKHIYKKGNQ